jgi:hypothetical protein
LLLEERRLNRKNTARLREFLAGLLEPLECLIEFRDGVLHLGGDFVARVTFLSEELCELGLGGADAAVGIAPRQGHLDCRAGFEGSAVSIERGRFPESFSWRRQHPAPPTQRR